jgi:hypothetical protein
VSFEIEPFVLKGGEIVVRKVKLAASEILWKKEKYGSLTLATEFFKPTAGDVYLACLVLNIATPDSYSKELYQPLYKYTLKEQKFLEFSEPKKDMLVDPSKPVVMFQRRTTIFTTTKP